MCVETSIVETLSNTQRHKEAVYGHPITDYSKSAKPNKDTVSITKNQHHRLFSHNGPLHSVRYHQTTGKPSQHRQSPFTASIPINKFTERTSKPS